MLVARECGADQGVGRLRQGHDRATIVALPRFFLWIASKKSTPFVGAGITCAQFGAFDTGRTLVLEIRPNRWQ